MAAECPNGRALVIGGSVGGLFAAGLLRNSGWDATIFERSKGDLGGRGAGIGLTKELLDAMARVGVALDPDIGIPVSSFLWLGPDGAVVSEHPRPMVASAWARIFNPLRAAFPEERYICGKTLVRVEQDADQVTALFDDGTRERGDLLVAADGSLSTVRRQYLPDVRPAYTGYVAWRGIVEECDLPAETLAALGHSIVFSFAKRELVLTMLVPGAGDDVRPGHRRCYFIWYRPAGSPRAMRDLFTDADGRHHGTTIPPPLIREDVVEELRRAARERLAPQVAAVVERAQTPLLQAISDLESPRLVFGRVALMGDAGFVARPHVAAGITKAALDALALADSLSTVSQGNGPGLVDALSRYEEASLEFGNRIVAHARWLGSYVEDGETQGRDVLRDPKSVMEGYGAPHLLHDASFSLRKAAGKKQETP